MNAARALFIAAALTAATFVGACTGPSASEDGVRDWNGLAITLERGVCFGTCPDYTVTVHGDGRVVFEGRRFVAKPGTHETQISREAVRALYAKFRKADFFALENRYHAQVTDLPTYSVTLAVDGRTKTVSDYGGRMMGMPEAVSELETAIDEAADTRRWIKEPGSTP